MSNEDLNDIIENIDELINSFGDNRVFHSKNIIKFYSLLENDVNTKMKEIKEILSGDLTEEERNMTNEIMIKLNKLKGDNI